MGVEVVCSPEVLDVRVDGWDRLWGLRSHIEVPMARVVAARVLDADTAASDVRIRTAGLGLPGVAKVGYFRGRQFKRQWWSAYRASELLAIDLSPDGRFDRLVLQLDDPAAVAAEIEEARSQHPNEPG